jgi:hypothetical protein
MLPRSALSHHTCLLLSFIEDRLIESQTAVVNAPVLHGIYRHGCNHIRIWEFGDDHCAQDDGLADEEAIRGSISIIQQSEEQHLAEEQQFKHTRGEEEPEQPHNEAHKPPPQGIKHKPTRLSATRASIRNSVSNSAASFPCS